MGTLFNKAFRGGTIESRKAEITKAYSWVGSGAADDIISAIRSELALTTERKMVSFSYYLLADEPTSLAIGYGKKFGNAFTVVVSAEGTAEGHRGSVILAQYVSQDAMPIHIDKVKALRERILACVRVSGGVVEDAAGSHEAKK